MSLLFIENIKNYFNIDDIPTSDLYFYLDLDLEV